MENEFEHEGARYVFSEAGILWKWDEEAKVWRIESISIKPRAPLWGAFPIS